MIKIVTQGNNWFMVLDIVLLLIILVCAFNGLNRGFLGSLFLLMCFLLSAYITIFCLPAITNLWHAIMKSETNPLFVQDDALFESFMNSDVHIIKVVRNVLDLNKYVTVGTIIVHTICFLVLHYFVKKGVKKICKYFVLFIKNAFDSGSFERLGGAFLGLVKGFIISSVMAFACVSACSISYVNNVIGFQINTSVLATSFSANGIVVVKSVGAFS